jgi:hypothetical protein
MKAELLINQHKIRKNQAKQWEFYNAHITKILNEAFTNYQKYKELLKLQVAAYAQIFPNFVIPPFVAPSLATMVSKTISKIVSMGGTKEGIGTTMEVDSIVVKVAIKSTQVVLDTIEAIIKTMHPSTCPPS